METMKWAFQIKTNDQGVVPGINQVKTKKYAQERAKAWADVGTDTRVLRVKKFDQADVVRGWEIIAEYKAYRPVAVRIF